MKRLTAEGLRGIWAGMTMSWDEKDRFDEKSYRTNVERMCRSGAAGLYTTGSSGEFYALDVDEFRLMVDIEDEICGRLDVPLQIGCCADSTRKVLALLEYAAGKKHVGGAQVVVPYWMELTDREILAYFKDLSSCAPDLPLVHYNIPRAKRYLYGPDYVRIRDVAPNLVGVKFTYAGANFGSLQTAIRLNPGVSFFVAEDLLVTAMLIGARGCYSSIIFTDPAYMLRLFDLASRGAWEEAVGMQAELSRFFAEAEDFIGARGEGMMDPVFDKGLAVASGCAVGSQRTRAPYVGWTDETVAALRAWLGERWPAFLHPDLPAAKGGRAR